MTKKEKIRFYVAILLSVIAVISSVIAIKCGVAVILSGNPADLGDVSGGTVFAYIFLYLTEILISVFAASASILGAFFTFSVRKQEKKTVINALLILFCVNIALAVLDILIAVIMSFS